jgi:hypothetical protein
MKGKMSYTGALGCPVRGLRKHDLCELMGPRRSLSLSDASGPSFYSEMKTCFGLAVALRDPHPQERMRCVFEVSDLAESRRVPASRSTSG